MKYLHVKYLDVELCIDYLFVKAMERAVETPPFRPAGLDHVVLRVAGRAESIQTEQFAGPLKVPIPRSRETIPGQGASSRASRAKPAERGHSSGRKRAVETRRRDREAQGEGKRCSPPA